MFDDTCTNRTRTLALTVARRQKKPGDNITCSNVDQLADREQIKKKKEMRASRRWAEERERTVEKIKNVERARANCKIARETRRGGGEKGKKEEEKIVFRDDFISENRR